MYGNVALKYNCIYAYKIYIYTYKNKFEWQFQKYKKKCAYDEIKNLFLCFVIVC